MLSANWFLVWCGLFLMAYVSVSCSGAFIGAFSRDTVPNWLVAVIMASLFTNMTWWGHRLREWEEGGQKVSKPPTLPTVHPAFFGFAVFTGVFLLGLTTRTALGRPSWSALVFYALAVPTTFLVGKWIIRRATVYGRERASKPTEPEGAAVATKRELVIKTKKIRRN